MTAAHLNLRIADAMRVHHRLGRRRSGNGEVYGAGRDRVSVLGRQDPPDQHVRVALLANNTVDEIRQFERARRVGGLWEVPGHANVGRPGDLELPWTGSWRETLAVHADGDDLDAVGPANRDGPVKPRERARLEPHRHRLGDLDSAAVQDLNP